MSDENKKSCWFLYLLLVILIPGNFLYFISEDFASVKQAAVEEYKAGGNLKSLQERFKNEGFGAVERLFDATPEFGAGLILQKAVSADETLKGQVKVSTIRLQKAGTLTPLEARFLLQHIN